MVTDTIGDFLTRIRNAQYRKREYVRAPSSKMLLAISKILKEENFIEDFEEESPVENGGVQKHLKVKLRYVRNKPAIEGLERVSRPGVRVYVGYRQIPRIRKGLGITILTTPKGVISGEQARKERIGGEFLCKVW